VFHNRRRVDVVVAFQGLGLLGEDVIVRGDLKHLPPQFGTAHPLGDNSRFLCSLPPEVGAIMAAGMC
jgi:hypothetical protein